MILILLPPLEQMGELVDGSTPAGQVGPRQGAAAVTDEQNIHGAVQQEGHPDDQGVQDAVEGRQGQDVAGEHGAAGAEGEEKHTHHHLKDQPLEDLQRQEHPLKGSHAQGEKAHHQTGRGDKPEGGNVVGEQQALPPDGQGVDGLAGTAAHEVGEKGHGQKDAEEGVDPDRSIAGHHQLLPDDTRGDGGPPAFREDGHGQLKEVDDPVKDPDGPEPGHVLPEESGIEPAVLFTK